MEEKIESLLQQLTLEEKISMLAGADMWWTVPVPRLGIPALKTTDGPFGARGEDTASGPTSACLPGGAALGATWNPELVERIGQALAAEVKSKGAHILLAPTVNIHRSPLAGRNFECFSEDPYLTARIAVAYINGLQSQGVGACIKHFVCNDSEFERHSMSSEVGPRALREIYLRPFEIAIREAKPWAVMSAYNRVNGIYCSENDFTLLDVLKGEWGFDGIVMSDWYGTYSPRVPGGGLDLEMPGPARWMGQVALAAVQKGEVSQEVIDDKVRRLLRTLMRVGVFERPERQPEQALNDPEQHRLARQVGGEAIVLLKNEGNVLPLNADKYKSIAVIGWNAKWTPYVGGGSARVWPHYVVTPLQAIENRAGKDKVKYAPGCPVMKYPPRLEGEWFKQGLTLQYFASRDLSGEPVHTEKTCKTELVWFGEKIPYVQADDFSTRLIGEFSVPASGAYILSLSSVGKSRLMLDGKTLIDSWDSTGGPTAHEGTAQVDLEAGRAYHLTAEFSVEPGTLFRRLRIGCMPVPPADPIADAVELAKGANVAIVFAGLTPEWESEGFDRVDMDLPGDQDELIRRVSEANPNTVVVLTAGAPLSMPWLDQVKGLAQAWYLGQETGNAVADVLFGDVNPSGKLPTTFPKRLKDNPAYINYPGENGKVLYGEGLYVGYRYYDKKDVAPLFPFGYGLSYTTFDYRNLAVGADNAIQVSLEVQNTGPRAGQEVVQVYVRDVRSRLQRPEKELKAFAKVALQPGETKTVSFTLDAEALSYYDPARADWAAESGDFEILVGASVCDIRLRQTVNWQAPRASGQGRLNVGQPLKELLDDSDGRTVLEKYVGGFMQNPQVELMGNMSLQQIAAFAPDVLTPEVLEAINTDLAEL